MWSGPRIRLGFAFVQFSDFYQAEIKSCIISTKERVEDFGGLFIRSSRKGVENRSVEWSLRKV